MIARKPENKTCGRSIESALILRFRYDNLYQTRLVEKFHHGLFHVGKTYKVKDSLFLQVINPTAGLFGGDQFHCSIHLEPSSKATLYSPSATQIFTMASGEKATGYQEIQVDEEALLEWYPNSLVPHLNASFSVGTVIRLAKNSSLFYVDLLSPGRVAYGESLSFLSLSSQLSIYQNENLIVREKLLIDSETDKLRWTSFSGESAPYYATIWMAGNEKQSLNEVLNNTGHQEIDKAELQVGVTQLSESLWVKRVASRSLYKINNEIRNTQKTLKPILKLNPPRI